MTLRELVSNITGNNPDSPAWDYKLVLINGSECADYCSCTIKTDRVFTYVEKQAIHLTEGDELTEGVR